MRMRRILAFVLAVVMLMGNTVTASATSASSTPISGNYNITTGENGETIISPIDVEEEEELSDEGQEVTPPADNVEEPNGGDIGAGDDGLDGDIPGGDENNGDLDSGEEGGDIDEPNGEDGNVDDPEAPAEGEEITTEEETTEEETTEEELLAPGPLFDGEGTEDPDEIRGADENVSLSVYADNVSKMYYFETVAEAVDKMDALVTDKVGDATDEATIFDVVSSMEMYIELLTPGNGGTPSLFSVKGDDLVPAISCGRWNLYLNGQVLNVVADGQNNTATIEMSISGYNSSYDNSGGVLFIESGVVLQLQKTDYFNTDVYLSSLTVNYDQYDTSEHIIRFGNVGGTTETGYNQYTNVGLSDVVLPTNTHIEIYDETLFTYYSGFEVEEISVYLPEGKTFRYNGLGNGATSAVKVTGDMYIDGHVCMEGQLTVDGTLTMKEGATFEVKDFLTLNNVATEASDAYNDKACFCINKVFNSDGTLSVDGSILIQGTVTIAGAPIKAEYFEYYHATQASKTEFEIGQVVLTFGMNNANSVSPDMFYVSGSELGIKEIELIPSLYVEKEAEEPLIYTVMLNNDWSNQIDFYSVQEIKDYIVELNNPDNEYTIFLPHDKTMTLTENLDFSDLPYRYISVYLADSTIVIDRDISICASMVYSGRIEVTNGATLTLLDTACRQSGRDEPDSICFDRIEINFDKNYTTGGLVFNSEESVASGFANMSYTKISGLENKSLTVYGELFYNNSMPGSQLYYGNVFEYEWDEEKNEEVKIAKDISEYALSVGCLNIYNVPYINSWGYEEDQRVDMGIPLTVDEVNLDGKLEVYSISVKESFTSYWGSDLVVSEESEINNLKVLENNQKNPKYLNIRKFVTYYENDTDKKNPVAEGIVTFKGSVEGLVSLSKWEKTIKENGSTYWSSSFNIDETAGLIDVSNCQNSAEDIVSHFSVESYYSPQILQAEVSKDNANIYEMIVCSDVNDIRLYDNDGLNKGFASLADVKEYIVRRNNKDATYFIHLNKNLAVYGDELVYDTTYAEGVNLYLNNHSLVFTADCSVKLDGLYGSTYDENGETIEQPNSKLSIGKYTITFLPRKQWYENSSRKESTISDLKVVSDSQTPGSIILGDANDISNSYVYFVFVSFTNKIKDLSLYGGIEFINDSTLTVSNKIYVENISDENRKIHQEACLDGWVVTTKDLDARNGRVALGAFDVTGTSYFTAGNSLTVLPISYTDLNNIVIDADEKDAYMPFHVDFRTPIYLPGDECVENPDFEKGDKLDYGHLTINGKITTNGTMHNPIQINRFWYCEWAWQNEYEYENEQGEIITVSEPQYEHVDEQELFEDGETILTATNSATTAKYFSIQGEGRCTKKVGTAIKADSVKLIVRNDNTGMEVSYTSLEDAVANMATDFASASADYNFLFCGDMKLTKNVTLPSFVQYARFITTECWQGEGDSQEVIGFYQREIDLNGYTLTVPSSVWMGRGLRVVNSKANATGKFTISKEGSALYIDESTPLVDENGNTDRAPVFDKVLVTVTNGYVELYADDNSNNVLRASFVCEHMQVNRGCWIIEDNSATSVNTITTKCLEVAGEYYIDDETVSGNEIENGTVSGNDTVSGNGVEQIWVPASQLTVNGIVVTDGYVGINGSLLTASLSATNSTVEVNGCLTTYWSEGALKEVPLNITLKNGEFKVYNYVHANNFTLSDKSMIEVFDYGYLEAMGEVKLTASKLRVNAGEDGCGTVRLGTLSVPSAYGADSMGDYTVENHGNMAVEKVSMNAGTLYNQGTVLAKTVAVKDFIAGENTSFICDTFANTGKAIFHSLGRLLVNGDDKENTIDGTLNNVYLQGYGSGLHEYALIGRGSDATINFTGTFTTENEDQRAIGFVSDDFAEYYDMAFSEEPLREDSEHKKCDAAWHGIWLSIMENPFYEVDPNDEKTYRFELLDDGQLLFNTSISSFPTDRIQLLGKDYWGMGEGKSLYQSGNELRVVGEYISVSIVTGGDMESHLKEFTNWNDAVAYINSLNNSTATYVIGIRTDMDIEGKLTLPIKAAEVVVRSGRENGDLVVLSYQGDIVLNTNTIFENISLEPYSVSDGKIVPFQSSIDTKGKLLDLSNVKVWARKYNENGVSYLYENASLKAIKGTATTQINLTDGTNFVVNSKISGINEVCVENGSSLIVNGGLSVNNLFTANDGENYTSLIVSINGASSILEVKNRLGMSAPSEINCEGSMKIKDIYSNCSGNILRTAKDNQITISGRVLSDDMGAAWNKELVVAEYDNAGNVVGYYYPEVGENLNEKQTAEVMPFAVQIIALDGGAKLASASLVSPIWFVTKSNDADCDFDFTHKEGNLIVSGTNANNAVILSAWFGEYDEEDNRVLKEMNRFGKLEDAFAEIDKIASAATTYVITLNKNVEMLNSSNKPADYTFPKQVAEVIITSNDGLKTISYNKELKLQSNVTFENVVLSANISGGNLTLDKFTLTLRNVDFAEKNAEGKDIAYSITGSGVGKGSTLVVEECGTIAVAKLSKVDEVFLNGTMLSVGGDAEIGNLYVENEETFIGLGKITIANIYSSEDTATIVTAPKVTLADKGKATEKVTKVEANMTVSGVIEGSVNFELYGIDADLANDGTLTFEKAGLDKFATEAGLAFVKATNANTEMVTVFDSSEYIYKKAGVFTYKSVGPQVELSYGDSTSTFETFADAVTEINNLKTKRDYTIRFIESSEDAPVTLTMPKAGTVDTLVLTAKPGVNVYYVKDIKFDSNVVLEDINFIQMVEVNKEFVDKATAIILPTVDKFYDPVKVTVNGAYIFDVNGTVTFNTPIALTGAKKATFVVDGDGVLFASALTEIQGNAYGVDIEGTVKDFAVLDVTNMTVIRGYFAGKYSADTWTYKAAELNVTTLNMTTDAVVYVGDPLQTVDSVTITNLNMSGGGLVSFGNGVFTNVTLSGNSSVEVYGQKFNITGTLTSATENALLVTVLDAKKLTSVLNVSGSVVLQDPDSHAIWVDVVGPEGFELGGEYTDKDVEKTYSNKLLTASKASLNAFLAYPDCVGGKELYDAETNDDGYILKKSGSDFLVYYAEDVEVALYTLEEEPGEGDIVITSCDYYVSFNEAVAAIEALKDTSADYMIELLNDVGAENAYEKVNLPTKAASLTIYSANSSAIYYNNDLTLGCNTLISEVDLKPQIANNKEKGIALKGYELVLDRIQTRTIGKITGNNKNDKMTVLANQNLTIAGDFTGVADFELLAENGSNAEITVTGKFTVKNLIFETDTVNLTVQGKGSSVTDIRSISEDAANNRLGFAEMTVNGAIETANPDSRIELNNTSVSTAAKYNGNKLDLLTTSKLATISKAALTNVDFFAKGTLVTNAQWSAKSVYNVDANANAVTVAKDGTWLVTCVDLAQASAYIDTLADKNAAYVIGIDNAIADTVVTDTSATSKITLPAKDKMASVEVDGADDVNPAITFTGDIATNGAVTLKDIKLANTTDFSISNKKNSDTKVDGQKVAGEGELNLENVTIIATETLSNGKAVVKGYLKNITGEKSTTRLTINNLTEVMVDVNEKQTSNEKVNLVGGITNILEMTLENTALTTAAKSEVSILKLASGGAWIGYGATVVGAVDNEEQSDQSYLGTYLDKNVPQMTINGSVSKPVMMKLYDFASKQEIYEARPVADANKSKADLYQNQPLVVAKTEAADKFIAEPFAGVWNGEWSFESESVQARKDAKNYVYNGDISGMEVLLVASVDGAGDTETYVATYVEAINIINNIGNKNADYTVKLRATVSNTVNGVSEIRTAGKDGVAAYGSLALPAANKAKSLTITSENERVRLAYTGTMAPKCDLNFENIILTEGTTATVDGKTVFTPSYYVTPALGSVNITFGEGVYTLRPNNGDFAMSKIAAKDMSIYGDSTYALVFSKVSANKGSELNISNNATYVVGDASVATLSVQKTGILSVGGKATITDIVMENSSTMNLNCKNAIKITNIKGDGELTVKTAYTDKEWLKAVTQLTIDGEMEMTAGLNVMQYAVNCSTYQLLNEEQLKAVLMNPDNKPATYQKLITAPKLQVSDAVSVITAAGGDYNLFKLDGVVYLTDKEPVVGVIGYVPDGESRIEKYSGNFFTWEQAVKEIDKLNHAPSKTDNGWNYEITLCKDIGAEGNPIKTLTLPAKAAKVTIASETGDEGIMMTGTSVSLKTNLEIKVPIVAMKKTGNNYYDTVYTLNAGNYALELNGVYGAGFDNVGWHEPQFKLSGSSKGVVTVVPGYTEEENDCIYSGMINQISNVGKVILGVNEAATFFNEEMDREETKGVDCEIKDGISGVGELVLEAGVSVRTANKDVNVKKLTMGESLEPVVDAEAEGNQLYDGERYVKTYISNPMRSHIEAKNITVSDTLTMASASMKAGTATVGDGKVTLTNVVFKDNHNSIEAKQDKNGKSQIQIKGTVSADGENVLIRDAAVSISLYYNNSARYYAQLTEGMVLLTAPKAASSWFWPDYESMGGMPAVVRSDENDPENTWVEPTFKPYKSGNDIKYGRVLAQDEHGNFTGELIEARVGIGGRPWEADVSIMEFMTLEEAVKAIDSMGLQKTVVDPVTGKATKEYETYYIQIVNDVNIGNDKGDGKYSALTLPAKAKEIILLSFEHQDIKFSGNITLKCNTAFAGIDLVPMKAVKGGAEPTTTNIAIGNYVLTWDDSNCNEEWYEENGLLKCNTYINNITGGAKGELVIINGSMIKANNITGLNAIRFGGCGIERSGQILTDGNITIKELHYQNMADGILRVCGNLTTNAVYVTGDNNAQIWRFADKTMKVNGVTLTEKDESGKTIKINESVIYSEGSTSKVVVDTISTSGTVLPGTKIINGKYLDANDWDLYAMRMLYSGYVTGNDLYLGTPEN